MFGRLVLMFTTLTLFLVAFALVIGYALQSRSLIHGSHSTCFLGVDQRRNIRLERQARSLVDPHQVDI